MMRALRSIRKMPRAVILTMLALVLIVRLAVPTGWMPVSDADGVRLTICTGTGALDAPGDMAAAMPGMHHKAHGQHRPDNGHDRDHVCPFTGVALALAHPMLPGIDLPPVVAHRSPVSRLATVSIGRGLAAPPPPATGPPILV